MRPALLAALGIASLLACAKPREAPHPAPDDYDPLALAARTSRQTHNREATVPAQCYTRTDGRANPCWVCHTDIHPPNHRADWTLQVSYAFSEAGRVNHWSNVLRERPPVASDLDDRAVLRWVREDNYGPLRAALARIADYPGYRPDLDLHGGFDAEGFARDGSHWRAVRYKPFPGAFWPTNGSTDDVMIRLPAAFRRDAAGRTSRDVYRLNLALVEASIATAASVTDGHLARAVEPVSEDLARFDLDGDGRVAGLVTHVEKLPSRYVGAASNVALVRGLYPEGTEFLHSVRYLDPDAPGLIAARMKELRYMKKVQALDRWAMQAAYTAEQDARDEGKLPRARGSAELGLRGDLGWQLQGFIEDAEGRLRLQSDEEHRFCMGCHDGIGVTADQTFSFPRKLPGAAGWRYQALRGIPDAPQVGHDEGEILTYFRRVGAGDELRANTELLARYFPDGRLDEAAVRGAADLAELLTPSRARALALDKAYRTIVREQSFTHGRDAVLAPAVHVHAHIDPERTPTAGAAHLDGRLQLRWP